MSKHFFSESGNVAYQIKGNEEKKSMLCFVCFIALRPKSTAMAIAGRSVHLTHVFLGRLEQAVNQ